MKPQNTLTRRGFLKLNVLIGGALAASLVVARAASATEAAEAAEPLVFSKPIRRLHGTPTDIALSVQATVWAIVDAQTVLRFDRAARVWDVDSSIGNGGVADANELSFPAGSRLRMAQWGRPNTLNRQLLVMGPPQTSTSTKSEF